MCKPADACAVPVVSSEACIHSHMAMGCQPGVNVPLRGCEYGQQLLSRQAYFLPIPMEQAQIRIPSHQCEDLVICSKLKKPGEIA